MKTDTITYIPLKNIEPNPGNRKVGGFDDTKLKQLAESIKAVGVQQPAIVRQVDNHYELVAGERRWRASKIAGENTLPCVIRNLDDITVLKIQTIENLQRVDIHPLDESDGYARLINEAGYTVELLAKEVGKSISYVYQRIKLKDLIPELKKLFVNGTISAGHSILIARLDPEQQKEVLKGGLRRWSDEIVSVRDLNQWIHQNILMELSRVTWKLDDKLLLPDAGSCKDCPKHTGFHPDLFADVYKNGNGKKDYCTDRKCFTRKGKAMVEKRKKELEGTDFLLVSDGYSSAKLPKGVLENWEWDECKKKDKGAKRVLVVSGDSPGRLTWGKKKSKQSYEPTPEEKKERVEKKRKLEIIKKFRNALYDEIVNQCEIQIQNNSLFPEVLKIIIVKHWGQLCEDSLVEKEGWVTTDDDYIYEEEFIKKQISEMSTNDLILLLIKMTICDDLYVNEYSIDDYENMKKLSKILEIDESGLMKRITDETPTIIGICNKCGCTDDDCKQCIEKTGKPCHWVNEEHTLCSACSGKD